MQILTNTQFLKLWGNQIFLQVAFNMTNFTALLLIDHLTESRFALATFYAAMTLPAFLVGLFAGAIVVLTDRKRLMLTTDFLLAGLGACTSMTIRLYADFKKIPLDNVSVRLSHEKKIHAQDCEDCDNKVSKVDHIERAITLEGALDDEQRKNLMEIADKCPVHQTLESKVDIHTVERAA